MLKDTFKWHACVEKVETTPCGGKVKISLLGYNDYPFGGCISNGGSGEALAKEIAYCVNNGTRDNMYMDVNSLYPTHPENKEWNDNVAMGNLMINTDMYRLMINSTYGARGQYKPLVDYTSGYPRGIVPLSKVTLHCGLADYIDDVIFNDPATIVKWKDGTKTVVKVQEGDEFDPMVGLAMCIAKKAMGNQGNYFEVFKKWCEPWYKEQRIQEFNEAIADGRIIEAFDNIVKALSRGSEEASKNKKDGDGFTLTLDEGHHCIDCRYCMNCMGINGSYLCVNPIIAKTEIKAPQLMSCPEWEAMPEPKKEGE